MTKRTDRVKPAAIRIGVAGAGGRMGRSIVALAHETPGIEVVAALEHVDSPLLGRDAGELAGVGSIGVALAAAAGATAFDVLIDFTQPAATVANVAACRAAGRRMVIGTTGLSAGQLQQVQAAADDIAIMHAPNMSVGVNLCFKLAELAGRIIGNDSDIEIMEAHHSQKQDAPSGTALRFGEVVAATLGKTLDQCAVYARAGDAGSRKRGTIGFQSIRAGDIVGDHTVLFAAEGERIEITHRALSRRNFAAGALRATRWIMGRDRGLFDMQDVLGLR